MVETITPVVHGTRARFVTAVALHALGATLSAAALGFVLGGVGALLGLEWNAGTVAVVAFVALLYGAREMFRWRIPLPQLRRQVPEWWRTFFSPHSSALLYGFGLGAGFFTYLSFGTFAAVGAAAIASGDPLVGAALCAPFGLARGLAVAVSANETSIDRLEDVALTSVPRFVNAGALAGMSATCALALGTL
jgi:hypothetical protein